MARGLHTTLRNLCAFIALSASLSPAFGQTESLEIAVGESHSIQLEAFAKIVNLSDDSVVSVSRGKNKSVVVIIGRRAGSSTIDITLESGQNKRFLTRVTDPGALRARLQAAGALLSSLESVKWSVTGGRIHVNGRLKTRGDVQKLEGIKAMYPGLIVDGTEKQLPKTNTVVTTINRVLSDNDIPNIQAHAYGKLIVLEGTPKDEAEAELAHRIAKMILPDIEDRMSKKGSAAAPVSIEVMFVEVQKKNSLTAGIEHKFGMDTPGAAASAQVNPITGQKGRVAWQVGPLSSFLELIQTTGASRVLSNPKLVTRSGEKATFKSGGTTYYVVRTMTPEGMTKELLPIEYGIDLGIEPLIDRLGQIDTKIMTRVADLGEKSEEDGPPSITESRVETAVTIKNGQSILLSGLINKRESKTVTRVPLLADIPIVGELFKKREITKSEVELLILVTINRVDGSDEPSSGADDLWRRSRGDVDFSFFD